MASIINLVRSVPRAAVRFAFTKSDRWSYSSFSNISPRQNTGYLRNYNASTINLELYRQLERRPKYVPELLQDSSVFRILNGLPKSFFFGRRNNKPEKEKKKRVPKLILLQNPLKWLMVKFDFGVLRNLWDPTFAETDFKYGTKQAVSLVTHLISGGQYTNLNGLLTKPARISLMRELDRNYSERQRALLALDKDDIQITAPRKVHFIKIADRKYCDVDMAFLALKWVPIQSIDALILTEIFARFHRDYTPHSIPEWTIAYFKITRFQILRRMPKDKLQ